MDLTQLFKASVKTVRLTNRTATTTDKTRILKYKNRNEFCIKANDIRYQITQLRDLLFENRAAYMRFGVHLKSSTMMTNEERNIIDRESEKIFLLCNKYLNDLRAECLQEDKSRSKRQVVEHQLGIIDILGSFLKDVFRMHREQKENRIQHELETYKLLKLESNIANNYQSIGNSRKFVQPQSSPLPQIKSNKKLDSTLRSKENNIRTLNISQSDVAIDEDQAEEISTRIDNMNTDDIQMLESENIQLLNDISGLSEEVDQIERNVVDIAKLQEIFSEKVTVQKFQNNKNYYLTPFPF